MSKLIVGNWKMHFNPAEASLLVHRLNEKITAKAGTTVVFCPPFIDLYPLSKEIDKSKFRLGSQNIHYLDEGPVMGEISPAMLKGLVDYAIIGHSERRLNAGETDDIIGKKVAAALRNGIKPILCVGESLMDRQHKLSARVVVDQLSVDLAHVTAEDLEDIVIAYEPIWAISKGDGRGDFAKPSEVEPMVKQIRETLIEMFDKKSADMVKILYGGSANPDNAGAYLKLDNVDGLLVGGASLNYDQFSAIVKLAQDCK